VALADRVFAHEFVRWLHTHTSRRDENATVLRQLGEGLRAFANEDYRDSAEILDASMPELSTVGGSDAQRQLFHGITEFAAAAA
jgi:hypothetical protein